MAQRKPTKRQQKFVEEISQPDAKSQAAAARKAGYSPKSARQIASLNMTKHSNKVKPRHAVLKSRFIDALANPEVSSLTEAALLAGYSPKSAKQIASHNMKKPDVIAALSERGITNWVRPLETLRKVRVQKLYIFQIQQFYKIGVAFDPSSRLMNLQVSVPFDIKIVAVFDVYNALQIEAHLHSLFNSKHVRGEWFELDSADLEIIQYEVRKAQENAALS